MANIAFIGLGNMGSPMAANLIKAGHSVCVFDLVDELVAALVEQGASTAGTADQVAANKDFVITMLPAGKHVEAVYLGDSGVLAALDNSSCIIDSSTIDAETARRVAAACDASGVSMMDCPVSGGVAAATAGTLSFMCGGSEAAFERIKPVLAGMGKNIFHAGGHGAGQVAKMCNNMLLAIHMIGTAEALQLGANNGLDASVLSEIMLASSGRNWSLEVYNPYPGVMPSAPASNDYQPGFMVNLMRKDLNLAMQAAQSSSSSTPLGELATQLYEQHGERGNGSLDFSSILQALAK